MQAMRAVPLEFFAEDFSLQKWVLCSACVLFKLVH